MNGPVPHIDPTAFIAANATIIGDVKIDQDCSVWFGCVVRGDVNVVRIGARTNIQDLTVIHVASRLQGTFVGCDVTVGHGAILHACTIGDGSFIGMRAMVMDGAVVENGAMVAAGAMVLPGKRVPEGELWAGSPARLLRPLRDTDRELMAYTAPHYVKLSRKLITAPPSPD